MSTPSETFSEWLDVNRERRLAPDELVQAFLPLMHTVLELHAHGRVAKLQADDILVGSDGELTLALPGGVQPRMGLTEVQKRQPLPHLPMNIVGSLNASRTGGEQHAQPVVDEDDPNIDQPALVRGYSSWELEVGHHDEITDVFSLGLLMATLSLGLDFRKPADLEQFARHHVNLFSIAPDLNPVIARLIQEMTALNRHERATSVENMARQLSTYRDQPCHVDVDRILASAEGTPDRRTAVLKHLRDRLFDLTRRNRLIQFRETLSTLNLTQSSISMRDSEGAASPLDALTWSGRFAKSILSGKELHLSEWLQFEAHPYVANTLDRIRTRTRKNKTEFGFSNLRLVLAFLDWVNPEDRSETITSSPLLWLPVDLVKARRRSGQYTIECGEPIAEINPALRHHLGQLYDIRLPETLDLESVSLEELQADIAAQLRRTAPETSLVLNDRPDASKLRRKAAQQVARYESLRDRARARFTGEAPRSHQPPKTPELNRKGVSIETRDPQPARPVSRTHWRIDLTRLTLANFNYKKMSLVRDYNALLETPDPLPSFDRVFSVDPREAGRTETAPIPTEDQWPVVPSDATQSLAVSLARAGESFIIQGPPGTGKSQTITNLIADCIAEGKRVLFVCEKRAALDVVYHRLHQVGLQDVCALVHDSQDDKRAFVHDLKRCYETWLDTDPEYDFHTGMRHRTMAAFSHHVGGIENFESHMLEVPTGERSSVRDIIRRRVETGAPDHQIDLRQRHRLPRLSEWDDHRSLAEHVEHVMRSVFGRETLASHPLSRLNPKLLLSDNPLEAVDDFITRAGYFARSVAETLPEDDDLLDHRIEFEEAHRLVHEARRAVETGLATQLDLLDPQGARRPQLDHDRSVLAKHEAAIAEAADIASHWKERLDWRDAFDALEQAKCQEESWTRYLSPSWWRLSRAVRKRYDFDAHVSTPAYSEVLERLVNLQAAEAERENFIQRMAQPYSCKDFSAFLNLFDDWTDRGDKDDGLHSLIVSAMASGDHLARLSALADLVEPIEGLATHATDGLVAIEDETLAGLCRRLDEISDAFTGLPEILPFLKEVDEAPGSIARLLRGLDLAAGDMEALIVDETVTRAIRHRPETSGFCTKRLAALSAGAKAARELMFEHNAAAIVALQHKRFLDSVRCSQMSSSHLDGDGQAFKARYTAGRRELEREFGKKTRYRSIRELAAGDSGLVVRDLKPVWLMSPLSIADTLPLEASDFDLIVFDEASQIPMEDAVPALSRARQVVVVGDEMQLPPTTFFAAGGNEDDQEFEVEEEGERISIVLDADSLLSQAARNLPATMLSWHYRSRSDKLISFSNAAFYEGRLTTIPDAEIGRTKTDKVSPSALSRMLARPVSLHRVEDGVYDRRRNAPEAQYIAELVRDYLISDGELSIGIVAFSEAQQEAIENSLDALAAQDSAFATLLEGAQAREDDGQFIGLFVKNLENVQGDERDIIILSICYAPNPRGQMRMNFGPINQRGGEKRLNVIFSRAKRHMAVVTTIHSHMITNVHNDGARALQTFLGFAEALDKGDQERASSTLAKISREARSVFAAPAPADPVRQQLAEALRDRGHVVDEWVGSTHLRCDLAVRDAAEENYRIGILLDRQAAPNADRVFERYVFQPGILKTFGWRIVDIPVLQWLESPKAVLERIERKIAGTIHHKRPVDPFAVQPRGNASAPNLPPEPTRTPKPAAIVRELRTGRGKAQKFWSVEINGVDLMIRYGRTGTQGRTIVKSFETSKQAKADANKRIKAKLKDGYAERIASG